MAKAITAIIIPFDPGAHPDQGLPKPQPRPPGSGPRPDQGLPGDQPKPDHGYLPHPEQPIYYPLPPGVPGFPPPTIDNTLPGSQPHPDQGLPGSQPKPDQGLPGDQPVIDNTLPETPGSGWLPVYIHGPSDPRPDHPIVIPPPVEINGKMVQPITIWTPENGWETYALIKPQQPVITPSKRK